MRITSVSKPKLLLTVNYQDLILVFNAVQRTDGLQWLDV